MTLRDMVEIIDIIHLTNEVWKLESMGSRLKNEFAKRTWRNVEKTVVRREWLRRKKQLEADNLVPQEFTSQDGQPDGGD